MADISEGDILYDTRNDEVHEVIDGPPFPIRTKVGLGHEIEMSKLDFESEAYQKPKEIEKKSSRAAEKVGFIHNIPPCRERIVTTGDYLRTTWNISKDVTLSTILNIAGGAGLTIAYVIDIILTYKNASRKRIVEWFEHIELTEHGDLKCLHCGHLILQNR